MSVKTAWPTHKAKARANRKAKASRRRRNRRIIRLYSTGKRGVVTQDNV